MRRRSADFLVIVCVLFSFGMSALLSRDVFERLPHLEDEIAYLYQARILARGQLTIDTPQPRLAFWQPFVIDHEGSRFGKYPLGYPAQLALGEAAGAPWMVNALLGALAVAVIYRLGCAYFSRHVGAIAALLLAFSPMALLLNATLMGHTSALCFTLLFMWAYQRLEASASSGWGLLAGAAFGMIIANRPLAALGVALPYAAWSLIRLWGAGQRGGMAFWRTLRPLALLSAVALLFAATIPLFSLVALGDPLASPYTRIWAYDRVGFGECCGRSGHTLAKAFNHLRWDLSLLAADLHGLQLGAIDDAAIEHLRAQADTYPNPGMSFALPALGGLVVFWRRRWHLALWLGIGALGLALAVLAPALFDTPAGAWLWVCGAGAWLMGGGYALLARRTRPAGWLIMGVALMPFIVHMTYWIGSQRYSTRYYYEALGALALLSALALARLTERLRWRWAATLLVIGCVVTLITYSLPRIGVLRGFNGVSQSWIDEARARGGDAPLLVIVTGTDLSWRAMGSFMAVTSPFLDSPIVAAYNPVRTPGDEGMRQALIERFPDRVVIDLTAQGADAAFAGGAALNEALSSPAR